MVLNQALLRQELIYLVVLIQVPLIVLLSYLFFQLLAFILADSPDFDFHAVLAPCRQNLIVLILSLSFATIMLIFVR